MKKDLGIASLLCVIGFFGVAGIHRLYMEKYVSGTLYLLTVGWFGFGTFIDLFTLPNQIKTINKMNRLKRRRKRTKAEIEII